MNTSPDRIPNIVYKKCKYSVIYPLTLIFNMSLHTKVIPDLWRSAIVKPIPKTKSSVVSQFRPISLTSSCAKIMEKNANGWFSNLS